MDKKWTKEQKQAIESRVPEMSVAASAGSGKTSTMVARIIDLLQHGSADVGELLVLTFTNESARDMRAKLSGGLEQRICELRDDEKRNCLVRQLLDLPSADIGTFHSFCGLVVRQWFTVADVNPNFSVIDEIEAGKMKAEIFEKMLVDCYHGAGRWAIDHFAVMRNFNALRETILDLHAFLESRENREKWLNDTAAKCYIDDPNENAAIRLLVEHYKTMAAFYRDKFIELGYNSTEPQHIVTVTNIITTISCYDDLYAFANMDTEIKRIEKGAPENYKELREDFKKNVLNEIKNNFKDYPAERLRKEIKNDRKIIDGLVYLVREFGVRYGHRKLEKNKMDFADLEKYTLRVLCDPTALSGVRGKYKYVFVDEGQDTNPVQFDIVKKMVFGDDGVANFFMVGDVKQSIYGFRGCDPELFECEIEKPDSDRHASISFNDNFRSNPVLLQFVNDIFCPIMRKPNYAAVGKFKTGAPYAGEKFDPVQIEIIDTAKVVGGGGGTGDGETDGGVGRTISVSQPYDLTADNAHGEDDRPIDAQIAAVVRHIDDIRRLEYHVPAEGKKPLNLCDIAILTENHTHFFALAKRLRESGIDCVMDEKINVVDIPAVAMLHNFLFAVSNWTNDIPLVMTMRSLAFGFTDDEIAHIRLVGRELPFIDCIKKYAAGGADTGIKKRLTAFINMLTKYHAMVRGENVAAVVSAFIAEYKYLERLDSPDGIAAVNAFIQKIKNMPAADSVARYLYLIEHELIKIEINLVGAADKAVRIMTIHGAKGLEFPAVILFNTTALWSQSGNRKSPVTVDRDFGICVQSADEKNYIRQNKILQLAVKTRIRAKELDEKMRLLYVALTRAKNHLYITGAKNMEKAKRYLTDTPTAKCMFDLIYAGNTNFLSTERKFAKKGLGVAFPQAPKRVLTSATDAPRSNFCPPAEVAGAVGRLRSAFAWEYPYKGITETHIKQSVTSLTRAEQETLDVVSPMKFANVDRAGAEYGTAFHKNMQYVDWGAGTGVGDPDIAAAVKIINEFLSGYTITREFPFLSALPDGTMVQGIIDLLAVRGKTAIIIDYKTTRADCARLVELYTPQLRLYADAVARFLPDHEISAYIYSTRHQKLLAVRAHAE